MTAPRFPHDVRLLEWADREDFGRVRAEWLQLHRWDTKLSPATVIALAEVAGRMAHDKNFAWPSIPRLAADLGWSEKTVKRAIAQAIEQGWLICQRRGFGGSNHYAMAASPAVTASVIDLHDHRVASFAETRPPSLGSKMTRMIDGAIEVNSDPSLGSKMTSHTGQKCPLIEVNSDPLTLSKNPINEPDHRTLSQGLSEETVQDEALGGSDALNPVVDDARLHRDVHLALGRGDIELGRLLADAIGRQQVDRLKDRVRVDGVIGAADELNAAADRARRLLQPKADGAKHGVA